MTLKNLLLYLFLILAQTGLSQSERHFAKLIQARLGGELEKVTDDKSRVDLLTSTHAYEIEYARKWKDAIGQSIWYALQTNSRAGIVLIMECKKDFMYVQKLITALEHSNLSSSIDVKVYPIDFPEQKSKILSNSLSHDIKSNHWLSLNSKIRHNSNCNWYEKSRGRYCSKKEGLAGQCCGG